MDEKNYAEVLAEELTYKKKSLFEIYDENCMSNAMTFANEYAEYLFSAKTERQAVIASIEILKDKGYKEYCLGDRLESGGKYYLNNRGKALFAFKLGSESLENGIRITAAHIDSPRLDLKQNPVFEDNSFAYLKTHYYGGVRKYQWPTLPLAIQGVIIKNNGEAVTVNIGEDERDPVFVITDLLPHLGAEQGKKPLNTAFDGEVLNILSCVSPVFVDGKPAQISDSAKLNLLKLLNEKYGIIEADFMSAELCAVPAGKPRDVGLDRILMGAYGHDDKVCAYPALRALCDSEAGEHTVICVLADKEETGSDGNTGMQSALLTELIDQICETMGANARICRYNSMCLSADVSAGFDPNFPEVFEKRNSAIVNCGVVLNKYTGSRGKYSTSDASAEFIGKVRQMFESDGVVWQTAELGKIDIGGGGTVAKYIANQNIDTVDVGVAVLSMHAPFEQISKFDLYETYRAFVSFCK